MARILFSGAFKRIMPPWAQRLVGGPVLEGLGDALDDLATGTARAVKLRLPTDDVDAGALALIGRERRIRRGPAEGAVTYAGRLRSWWDDHRVRGGPYALLRQLFLYWRDSLGVPIDLIYQSGTRYQMDAAGDVVRDAISWEGDGGDWASTVWLFFHLADTFPVALVTADDDALVTQDGDEIVALSPTAGVIAAMGESDLEIFRAVPREWSSAHIPYITIVLLYGAGWVFGYPEWDFGPSSGRVFGEDVPLIFTTEA